MSFLKNLFNRNNRPKSKAQESIALEEVEVASGLLLPRAFADHFAEIEKTARRTVTIKALPSQEPLSIKQSKFGHYPCIPKGFPYPRDKDGRYLYPLAQINFSEVPSLENFPDTGYLQFYIGTDDSYGLSFDESQPGEFKVLFFEESEVKNPEEDLSFLDQVLSSDVSPVETPHSLTFQHKTEYVGLGDFHGERNNHFQLEQILEENESASKELEKIAYNIFIPDEHKIGGYAYFTQSDPREYNKAIQDHILLFQMNSDEKIMWGDAGVANFFIHPDDLAKKDFSKVWYAWDCC